MKRVHWFYKVGQNLQRLKSVKWFQKPNVFTLICWKQSHGRDQKTLVFRIWARASQASDAWLFIYKEGIDEISMTLQLTNEHSGTTTHSPEPGESEMWMRFWAWNGKWNVSCIYIYIFWLVLCNMWITIPCSWEFQKPNWLRQIFQRGRYQPTIFPTWPVVASQNGLKRTVIGKRTMIGKRAASLCGWVRVGNQMGDHHASLGSLDRINPIFHIFHKC